MKDNMQFEFTIFNDEGEEVVHALPGKHEVCPRCGGHGTHLCPSIGEHAYTAEEFNREFDHDEREEYFTRGGMYDVQCETCNGKRVVLVVDAEAAKINDSKTLELYEKWEKAQAEAECERQAELRWQY